MKKIVFGDIVLIYKSAMKYLIIALILSLFLVGCQSVSRNENVRGLLDWNYGDLKLLDAIDAAEPEQDLIALYTRIIDQSFQIRLDFLDLKSYIHKDIYIFMDTNPGGATSIKTTGDSFIESDIKWDYLIKIPATGNIEVLDDQLSTITGMEIFSVIDSAQDRMIISFYKRALPIYFGLTKLQVIITPSKQNIDFDKSEPFSIDAPSPSRAKVLFVFWNTFSSITPAQTLRSWAGAHSGPMSSRHGLQYLLDAAAQTKSTIILLDLLTPDNLSALDYIHAIARIRNLANQGILALPHGGNTIELTGADEISWHAQITNKDNDLDIYKIWQISTNMKSEQRKNKAYFDMFINNLFVKDIGNYYYIYNDYAQFPKYFKECEILPFFTNDLGDRFSNISLDCRRFLLSYALLRSPAPLILGGDFSNSILGDPSVGSKVFSYINSHPWIQVLSIGDLMSSRDILTIGSLNYQESTPVGDQNTLDTHVHGETYLTDTQNKIYEALMESPNNHLTDLAVNVFFDLTQSVSPELLTLQSNYIGQIGFILAGAKWADNPSLQITCDSDLDYDGTNECVLANKNVFAIIEPVGGYIPFVFAMDARGIHQIIGPTWEFAVGLSDPSSWNLDLGERGDPTQILGAFQDRFDNWNSYRTELINNNLYLFTNTIRKSITILPNSLRIDIQNLDQMQSSTDIPLVIDPWFRYTSGWGDSYVNKREPFNTLWGIKSGEMVEIRATNPFSVFSFNDMRMALYFPEDPNFDYLQGHYLPFPMSVVTMSATDKNSVDIILNP